MTAIVVDPASYAALVASTEGFFPVDAPPCSARPWARALARALSRVLASPQAAALFWARGQAPPSPSQQGLLHAPSPGLPGELPSTPAQPAGGAFIVVPASAIRGASPPPANLLLLTGPSIDMARLNAAARATMPGTDAPAITTRSARAAGGWPTPLQQGTFLLFTLAIAFAAALALAVMLLGARPWRSRPRN